MLSPGALLLEESLAVSALTLSACSQCISSAEESPPPQLREGVGLGREPRGDPTPRAHRGGGGGSALILNCRDLRGGESPEVDRLTG